MKFPEEANCMFICDARGRAGLSIAPAGAEVTNVAGVASFLSGSILPSGASGKFHANRHIELTGPDQTVEGFGPGGRAWRTGLEDGSAEWVCGIGLGNGTFHDFGLQRGWFRSGC